ncbi:MAG: ACT domain-containing protein [Candidatus Micrarchaeia archaeon]|jgi:hypothetical protein
MKQITIFSENKTEVLADICALLGNSGVNIESISAQGELNKGVIRIITTDPKTAEKVLSQKGYKTFIGDILILNLDDKPGELAKVIKTLSKEGIDLETLYLLSKEKGITHIAVRPIGDIEKAKLAIKSYLIID